MAKTLQEYYSTNYTQCHVASSFFGSWQGLAYTSHFTQLFAVPVQLLTFCFIIFKTPAVMKCMKWPLLVSHYWCSALDFSFGTLCTPYWFYPQGALFGCGLLDYLGVPIQWLVIPGFSVIFCMATSVIYLFEVRSSAIHNNRWKIKKTSTRVAYYIFNLVIRTPLLYLFSNNPKDQEAAKLASLIKSPCPTKEFFTEPVFIMTSDSFWTEFVVFRGFPIYIFIVVIQILFFISCSLYYLFIFPSSSISSQTREFQIHFFIGITIQFCVPFVVIVVTYAFLIGAILMESLTQGIMNMCMVTITIHGLVESLAIILIHRPYRKCILEWFSKKTEVKDLRPRAESLKVHPKATFIAKEASQTNIELSLS